MRTYGTRSHDTKEMFEKRKEKVLESSLYKELQGYQNAGMSLWLNGRPSTSYGIANYVREESDYMRDYRFDGIMRSVESVSTGQKKTNKTKRIAIRVSLNRKLKIV